MSEDKKVKETKVEATEVKSTAEKKQSKTTKSKAKAKDIKVRILCANAAGKYKLPYSKGVITTLPAKQAEEMIENKDATTDLKKHQVK